ncbi:hypothetical protein [Enterococcus sp.]|uniref:hypothetical protein n=1 Tax=Enterococcus sp. TaxID=35783 RepID=UPI002FCA844D
MDKNLRNIFQARYGAVLLLLVGGILIFYISSGFNFVKNWQSQHTWYHSKEFTQDYAEYSYDIKYQSEDEIVYYENIDEFRQERLTIFEPNWSKEKYDENLTPPRFKADHSYEKGLNYWSQYNHSLIIFSPWILFILGFSLFFIDLKTNFNSLLFSLPYTKKQIFKGKLRYMMPPIFISLAVGILIHQFLIHAMIPDLYLNATLGQMLYSGMSHWFLLLLAFSSGTFIGTLLGNLVTGPLLVAAGFLSLTIFYDFLVAISNLFDYFGFGKMMLFFKNLFGEPSTLTITTLGKSGSMPAVFVLFSVLSLAVLFIAQKIFENTSLESNGKVLTVPRFRRRFFIILAIISSFYFTIATVSVVAYFEYDKFEYYSRLSILPLILVPVICTISSFIVTYYDEIFKFWNKRYLDRMTKKIQ